MSSRDWWLEGSSTHWPSLRRAASTFSFEPVRKYQPGRAWKRVAYSRIFAGVSWTGSTEIEISRTSLPTRSPRCSWIFARVPLITGQAPVQAVNMGLMITVLPSSRSV